MSRAFVKDGQETETQELPERLVSPHANLVTAEGLAYIEAEAARLEREHAAAQASGDRDRLAMSARDLRYWQARRASAELVAPPPNDGEARFGSTVTIGHADGPRQTFRIVGEDEADPARGTLSYVSPLAQALLGKGPGDSVRRPNGEQAEILKVE